MLTPSLVHFGECFLFRFLGFTSEACAFLGFECSDDPVLLLELLLEALNLEF